MPSAALPSPFSLEAEQISRMLNCELADHPLYDGVEIQWFDDPDHGTGMLAFLSRRDDRSVDFYVQPGLRLRRELFSIGGGIRSWQQHDFGESRLEVTPDGVVADVSFTDVDGRTVEIRIDDRDGRNRHRARLLAPVSAAIEDPTSFLAVYMTSFDLVRRSDPPPVIRIDGAVASTGRLPGRFLHRRELIKYAADLVAVRLSETHDGPVEQVSADTPGPVEVKDGGIARVAASSGEATARLRLSPPFPDLALLRDGSEQAGTWSLEIAGDGITGGTWWARRRGREVELGMDTTRRWEPKGLPLLMRIVTRIVPTFRRWPTTYCWRGLLSLDDPPTLSSTWSRTGQDDDTYRRATGSAAHASK